MSDFLYTTGIDCVVSKSESMSRRNMVSRNASSPKAEEKVCISFSSHSMPGKGLYSSSRHMKPISLANYSDQVLKPKKMVFERPAISLNAAPNIIHPTIADLDSS